MNVRLVNGTATATSRVEMGANLDSTQAPIRRRLCSRQHGRVRSHRRRFRRPAAFFSKRSGFRSARQPHNIFVAFLKDPATSTWNVEVYADPAEVETGTHPNGLLAAGQITFNGDGALATSTIAPLTPTTTPGAPVGIDWLDSATAPATAWWSSISVPGETDGLSQFASNFNVVYVTQNGAEVGQLNGVSINEDGFVIASFSNGEQQKLYKLPISNFFNPLALNPRSGNVYSETVASGTFNLREAGIGGAGKISPSSLEAANVDIADEFTKMIVTQRAYSANARIITTTDEMLDELIRISR